MPPSLPGGCRGRQNEHKMNDTVEENLAFALNNFKLLSQIKIKRMILIF